MSRDDSGEGRLLVSHCRHQGGGLFPEKIQLFLQLASKFSNFCPDFIRIVICFYSVEAGGKTPPQSVNHETKPLSQNLPRLLKPLTGGKNLIQPLANGGNA